MPASRERDLRRSGVRAVVRRTYHSVIRHRVVDSAASLTFFALLTVFPTALTVVSLLAVVDQGKKLIAWERPLRSSDHDALRALGLEPPQGDILAVRVADEGVKFALIAEEPDLYFTTPHFDGYPAVLVRLAAIDQRGLRELIVEAWLTQAPKRLVQEFFGEAR